MARQYAADDVRELAESGICEPSRLLHILRMISAGRPLYNSDRAYLDRMSARLASKESALRRENSRIRRVLGAAPDADNAAAAPASGSSIAPRPCARAAAGEPTAANHGANAAAAPGRGSTAPAAPRLHPRSESRPAQGLPAGAGMGAAAPHPYPYPPPRRSMIDDSALDGILESRVQRRRRDARERAAEAAGGSGSSGSAAGRGAAPPAPLLSPPPLPHGTCSKPPDSGGAIAGRLKAALAGRRSRPAGAAGARRSP